MTKKELISKLEKYDDEQEILIINPLIKDSDGGSPAFDIVDIFEDDWESDGSDEDEGKAVALIFTDNYLFNGEYNCEEDEE